MRILILLAFSLLLTLSTGCATVVRGEKQTLKFDTEPEGATVDVDGKQKATTPAELELKRKEVHTITITKEGYHPVTFEMKAQWDGMALGNAVMPGGSIGTATDRVNGADLAFYTVPKIKLTPATSGQAGPIKMHQYKGGRLLTQQQYDAAVAEDRKEAFEHRE